MSLEYIDNKEYDKTSRYQILRVVVNGDSRYLETYNQKTIPESDEDTYHIVSFTEEGRLDLIANDYYGSPSYWWVLAIANNLIDPFDFKQGVMMRIPPMSSVTSIYSELLFRRS